MIQYSTVYSSILLLWWLNETNIGIVVCLQINGKRSNNNMRAHTHTHVHNANMQLVWPQVVVMNHRKHSHCLPTFTWLHSDFSIQHIQQLKWQLVWNCKQQRNRQSSTCFMALRANFKDERTTTVIVRVKWLIDSPSNISIMYRRDPGSTEDTVAGIIK